jgi:GTP cyclohydrolase II
LRQRILAQVPDPAARQPGVDFDGGELLDEGQREGLDLVARAEHAQDAEGDDAQHNRQHAQPHDQRRTRRER